MSISWGCTRYEDNPIGWWRAFQECIDILNRCGVKYFLYGGTLLGFIRDRDFIPWDTDIDIIVVGNTDRLEEAVSRMIEGGFITGEKGLCQTYDKRPLYTENKVYIGGHRLYWLYRHGCRIDLIVWQRDRDWLYEYTDEIHRFPFELFRELKWIDVNMPEFYPPSVKVLIPAKWEDALTYLYGDWRTPRTEDYYNLENRALKIGAVS